MLERIPHAPSRAPKTVSFGSTSIPLTKLRASATYLLVPEDQLDAYNARC